MVDQLSSLSTGDAAELTCQTSPLPDPRQLATSDMSGQALTRRDSRPANSIYPLAAGNRRCVRASTMADRRIDFVPFDKEAARSKEQSSHVTEPTEVI
ncbi:hypothetical protein GW17_00042454 [Ensete ventricosum]|nr:hypothetical protein GW17_00042454 [Ensete ventricosum]